MLGTKLTHYEITSRLGVGGMGEVYRARDTKLDRAVAIKVLPADFANHPERVARFEREAKALARLSHPNVAAIYGFDHDEGVYFLVLELIEGETLQECLQRGPLSVEETLQVFQQIAEALEAAHEQDIVHRDLKPANIKIDLKGRVKVLDFGLAKARLNSEVISSEDDATATDSNAPTITSQFTQPGKVMGTAAYMSPEQSRGLEVDRRTDVWAFGCCLYEALTGNKPFSGKTASDLMAEILKTDPDFTVIPPETPSEVMTLLRRSLEKDPRKRLRDLGDIAITLEDVSETSRLRTPCVGIEQNAPLPVSDHPIQTGIWRWMSVGLLLLGLMVGYLLPKQKTTTTDTNQITTLTVLPFESAKDEDATSWLSSTLHEALIKQLGPIEELTIKPAGSSEVDASVQGVFVSEAGQLHVTVSLENHLDQTKHPLLSETYVVNDILDLQDDIAIAVANEIRNDLTEEELAQIAQDDQFNSEAYIEYRKGIDALDVLGFARAEVGIAHFETARTLDPNFLPPYIQQAWATWWPTIYGSKTLSSRQAFDNAFDVLKQAQAREAFSDKAIIGVTRDFFRMTSHFEFRTTKRALESALTDNPNDPDILFMRIWYLLFVESRYTEAFRDLQLAIAEAPHRVAFQDALGEIYSFLGDEEAAIRINTSISNENAQDFDRLCNNAYSHKILGQHALALKSAKNARKVSNDHPASIAVEAEILAAMGNQSEARKLLDQVNGLRDDGQPIPHNWNVRVLIELGDIDAAVSMLRKAYENNEGWSFLYTMRFPYFVERLAKHPGYWKLVKDMDYPDFPIGHPLRELEQEWRYVFKERNE